MCAIFVKCKIEDYVHVGGRGGATCPLAMGNVFQWKLLVTFRSCVFLCQFPHLWHFITACTSRHFFIRADDMMAIIFYALVSVLGKCFQVIKWEVVIRKLRESGFVGNKSTRWKLA